MKYFVYLIVIVTFVEFSSCRRGSYAGTGAISANPAPVQPVTNNKQNDIDYNLNNNIRQPVNVNSIPSDSWFGNEETVYHGNRR